jgi:hypothetical protein
MEKEYSIGENVTTPVFIVKLLKDKNGNLRYHVTNENRKYMPHDQERKDHFRFCKSIFDVKLFMSEIASYIEIKVDDEKEFEEYLEGDEQKNPTVESKQEETSQSEHQEAKPYELMSAEPEKEGQPPTNLVPIKQEGVD